MHASTINSNLSQQEVAAARKISTDVKVSMTSLTALACLFDAVVYLLVRHIRKALGAEPGEVAEVAESIRAGNVAMQTGLRFRASWRRGALL
jgi:hypothetical protein